MSILTSSSSSDQHRVDPKVRFRFVRKEKTKKKRADSLCIRLQVAIEDTVGAMKKLQDEGKVKHLGLSECSAAPLRRASKVAMIAAVQWEASPLFLHPLTD